MPTIGVINSGGDVQGINAVIASAVVSGQKYGYKFIGFIKGWEGLLDKDFIELDRKAVRNISHVGGTILHSVNKGRFAGKAGQGSLNQIPQEIIQQCITNLKELNVDYLIVIGGDGTLSGAMQLADAGVKIVGVPKTIDNDLNSTDKTFGFSTAVDIAVEAIDRIHTTAASHDRVILVETMGRHAGWIALYAGLAGGASCILIPEIPFDYNGIVKFLEDRKDKGRHSSIIVVAEGASAKNEELSVRQGDSNRPEVRIAGISERIIQKLETLLPNDFEMRNVVLGHIQRGGSPNAEDRILAKNFGVAAVEAIKSGKFGAMVSIKGYNQIITIPIPEAVAKLKRVTTDSLAYHTAKEIGIYFGE